VNSKKDLMSIIIFSHKFGKLFCTMVFIRRRVQLNHMLIPVRCFTCGKLVGDKYAQYLNQVKTGEDPAKVMDSLNMTRYCCRRMFVSSVETIYQVIPYYEALRRRMSEIKTEIE